MIAVLYTVVFTWQTYIKKQQRHWFWSSFLLFLTINVGLLKTLPNLQIIRHFGFHATHLCVLIGSLFFLINDVQIVSRRNKPHLASPNKAFLMLFCFSNILMHVAFATILGLMYLIYPSGISIFLGAKLLQFYYLTPNTWLFLQMLLMLLFYLHRVANKQPADLISTPQLSMGLLLTLCWQAMYLLGPIVLLHQFH